MDSTTSSLDGLSDIILPAPVPSWPPGQGVFLLLLALAIAALLFGYLFAKRQRANRYRREGLLLLDDAMTVHDVSVVLKRVALAAFPPERVASLYGKEWRDFLATSCRSCDLSGLEQEAESRADKVLLQGAGSWIRQHKSAAEG